MTFLGILSGVMPVNAKLTTDYRNALIFAYSPVNSVFEDDNIKLQIYDGFLWATNKTTKTIFIDLSQCFLINNGSSYPMYTEPTDEKKASRASLNTDIGEFISIAPAAGSKQNETFICNLQQRIAGDYTSTESPSEDFSEYDTRLLNLLAELIGESRLADPKGKNYTGAAARHLTEDESISNIGASIAYAFNKRAEDWTSITISTWVSDLIFAPYYVHIPPEPTKKQKTGFSVKKTVPAEIHVKADSPFEFEDDKSPILVLDWEGDFKKGTFTLKPTFVLKKTDKKEAERLKNAVNTSILANPDKTYHKSVIRFDGNDGLWGKMSYVSDMLQTGQSK